jgi:hypothetical protein
LLLYVFKNWPDLFFDAELGDGAGLGRALGAEDLAARAAVVLPRQQAELKGQSNVTLIIIEKNFKFFKNDV